jgi:biopolymer transport protein ExbD
MAKFKISKGSPSIDMTPMVDLAFLLVTFFILTATTRKDEIMPVVVPSSIGAEEVPENNVVMISVDTSGMIYMSVLDTSRVLKQQILATALKDLGVKSISPKASEAFISSGHVGVARQYLDEFWSTESAGRSKYAILHGGIPSDSTNNELKIWVNAANNVMNSNGEINYLTVSSEASSKGKGAPDPYDFKPKFVLKASGTGLYVHAKTAIETFRDLKLNNLNFVTNSEASPELKAE